MAVQRTLELDFMGEFNRTHRMRVYDAKEDLAPEDVVTAMDEIITRNVFSGSGGELTGKVGARIVTREVSEIELV